MRKKITLMLCIVMIVAVLAAMPMNVRADEFEDQPEGKHSNIGCHPTTVAKDAESIVDKNFAKELHDALGDNGFHSMVITFCQCYGGGMMDDVADQFAGSTKPISMTSGSKHDEWAGDKRSTGAGGKNDGHSRWGQAVKDVHPGKTGNVNNNPKESDAYDNAKNTCVWKNSNPKYTPQQKTLNNGGDIKLGDGTGGSGATSYHAILFAGSTAKRDDYWNNIARQQEMLTKSGYPAANIKTLYGDGNVPPNAVEPAGGIDPDPATRQNLIDAIKDLKDVMNSNEQLYIFISDHGSPNQGTDTLPKPKTVPPKPSKEPDNTFEFPLLDSSYVVALYSPHNTNGPYIMLNVETSGTITSNWEVFFNDNASAVNGGDNTFPGGGNATALQFPIDLAAINFTGKNDIWLKNSQIADDQIEVEIYFSMGDIETTGASEGGARTDLDIYWYSTQAGAFAALQAGDIDLIQGSITEGQRTAVEADPNLSIAAYVENEVVSYDAWWKTVAGVVNMHDYGLENTYTFLNSYYTPDQQLPLLMGCTAQPENLNILYSQGDHEYAFLDRVYTNLLSVNPYDIVIDQPWVAQDWEVGTWLDPQDASEKTVATYWIQQDVGIATPETGVLAGFLDAEDAEFTIWYIYSFPDSYQWNNVAGVHHTEIIDNYAIKVYFDDFNASLPMELGKRMPLLVSDELLDLLCRQEGDSWTQVGTNEYMLTYDAVQVCNASLNGTPLLEGWDYIIRGDDVYAHSVFVPLRDLTGTVSITYWYADIPANGFYLAGLPWNQTMFSLGTHYPTTIQPEEPANASLNKNTFFFLETPPLGETDWRWRWDTPGGIPGPEIPGRDSGYYQINIYDVIKATACYRHHGNGPYDPMYFPGADLDHSDLGHIGIYDVVTITGKYGMKWGHPDT